MAILWVEATSWPYFQISSVKKLGCELVFYHPESLSTFASFDISYSC